MEFYNLVNFLHVLQQLVAVADGREIIISQSRTSADVSGCGSGMIPCRTITYTMSISEDGDILSLDGGTNKDRPYWYHIGEATHINKSIVIQKWYLNNTDYPKPTIFFNGSINGTHVFHCYRNISLLALKFCIPSNQSSGILRSWFYLLPTQTVVLVSNCEFTTFGALTLGKKPTIRNQLIMIIHITNSKFLYSVLSGSHRKRHYIMCGIEDIKTNCTIPKLNFIISFKVSIINNSNINYSTIYSFNELIIQNTLICRSRVQTYYAISIHNSTFEDSYIINTSHNKTFNITNCIFDNSPLILKRIAYGTINNTVFQNIVVTKMLPALIVDINRDNRNKHQIKIIRCLFRNNTSHNNLIPTIYIKNSRPSNVEFVDSDIITPKKETTVFDLATRITVSNCSFRCGSGHFMRFIWIQTFPRWRLTLNCNPCNKGSYSLFGDYHRYQNLTLTKSVKGNDPHFCHSCPPNGVCENGDIRSRGAYWGYVIAGTSNVTFFPCPTHYCCPSFDQCLSYNTCSNNRTGRLCSDCHFGYSCSLNGNYRCVSNNECDNGYVGFAVVCVISIVLVLSMLYLKETLLFIKRLTQTKQYKHDEDILQDESQIELLLTQDQLIHMPSHITDGPVTYQMLRSTSTQDIAKENYRKTTTLISGSVKILFFFYQTSSIIRIQSPEKLTFAFPKFFDFLLTFFNVRIDLSYSKSTFCMLPNLSVIDADVLKLGMIGIVLLIVLFVWFLCYCHHCISHIRDSISSKPPPTFTIINDEVPSYSALPMLTRIKCAYLQFLLIGFSSFAVFCFNAVHCVNINNRLYLYRQASIQCYQAWQYFIICAIAFWIVPFFFTLHVGSKLLHQCRLTPSQFLAVLSFPPLLLPLWIKSKLHREWKLTKPDAMAAKHLLLVMDEPFKESSTNDGSRMCWESVLILRRMILVVMKTFIVSPIIKLYPMGVMLLVFTFQHVMVAPFSDARLNKMEFYSLNILGSFLVVNIFWAMTREYDLFANPSYKMLGKILLFYEMVILALPFLMLVLCLLAYILKRIFVFYKLCLNKLLNKHY